MYYNSQTQFRDVPVSVTMEDEPKTSGDDIGDRMQSHGATEQEEGGARLLQVTMAAVDVGAKEEIVVDSSSYPATETETTKTETSKTTQSDEYILQRPTSTSGDSSLEAQIEQDFQQLSEQERQQVYFDMRGDIFKAKPTAASDAASLLQAASKGMTSPVSQADLEALNRELLLLLENPEEQKSNPSYQSIWKILSSSGPDFYANSTDLRTKLLRAEHNHVKKAARRTADFFSMLCDLFGENLLSRPIQLSDLSTAERQLQRKGFQQLFRFRDQSEYRKSNQERKQSSEQEQQQRSLQDLESVAGRRIAGSFDLCRCVSTTEPAIDDETAKTRVLLYLMQVASDDEETQTQGIVFIFMLALRAVLNALPSTCPPATSSIPTTESQPPTSSSSLPRTESDNIFGNDSTSESDNQSEDQQLLAQLQFSPHETTNRHNHTITRVRVLSKIFRSGPLRVSAIHVCSPDRPELQEIKLDFLKALGRQECVRTRFHNGTSMECSLSLNKVGIPTDRLPLKYDGTIKTEDHLQWIAIQEAKESAAKQERAFDIVECPMNMDILSGRGQLVRSHPGNVSFRKDFIRARSARYDMASNREEKNSIADEILDDISKLKRKFLKQHQGAGYWTELDKKTAKEKVMMAFREFRKSQRNQQQQQQLRKARSQTHLQHQTQPQARPPLPLSQSLPHSPVTQTASQHRRAQSRSPSQLTRQDVDPTPQHQHQHQHQQQQQQQPPTEQASIHYQLYPPTTSSESFHHPPHHLAGMVPPTLPYYVPHPPPHHFGYPPHLLPPPHPGHHSPYPPMVEHANIRSEGVVAASAAAPPMGYAPSQQQQQQQQVPPGYHPNYYLASGADPRVPKDETETDGDGNERRYKRYKTH